MCLYMLLYDSERMKKVGVVHVRLSVFRAWAEHRAREKAIEKNKTLI